MNQQVVVVDDERKIARFISANLKSVGYKVTTYLSGVELLENFDLIQPDIILLDVMMPEMDGFEVLARLRKFTSTPVIVLTARSQAKDKVEGLNLGADDYLTKPFSLDELFARVKAVLRRTQPIEQMTNDQTALVCGAFKIDFPKRRCWIADQELKLTNTEYSILELLAMNSDKVVTHEQVLSDIWGPEYRDEVEYLRVAIARIRGKLKKVDKEVAKLIVTYPGAGYLLTTNI
ncbi:Transcriptional regulatory protein YycF [Paraliobacillus sp. PM-2]|uniref:response regulator transcription factor n=1 Tax=Paraliobacillus sp. PM-2 TaxID=1462524 RepID=UPI00061C96B1|nr:response regulator transcription factor [Paraliobacillus sp. PM-2]CQR46302.1 Transcriptional regulatory protein YycF [Paraliobacillus sp. PM-2]